MTNITLVEIDKKDPADCKFISDTVLSYYPKSPFPPTPQDIAKSHNIYFKAFRGQDIIGMSGYTARSPFLCETIKTIVFNQYRGQGLGKDLSQAIEDECKTRGFKKIMTCIYDFNLTMIGIKLKQGYKIEGYHRDHEKPGQHEYTLGKFLG